MTHPFHSFKASAWLGWQTESNWADPLLFIVYSVVKPISASLILVVMYWIVTYLSKKTQPDLFTYFFIGNAFFIFVMNLLYGISWTLIGDREWHEMLKYIYISPVSIFVYLTGRGFVKFVLSIVACAVTLLFGFLFLNLQLHLNYQNIPYFLLVFLLGILGILALGLIVAGVCLVLPQQAFAIGEYVGGIFYLLSGAIFPIEVLPTWLQPFCKMIPFTYWLEALRRIWMGKHYSTAFASLSNSSIFWILLLTTVSLSVVAYSVFRLFEWIARKKGLFDLTTGW